MAYGVTPEGWVTKDLATIRAEVEAELRAEIDPLLDLSDQTPMGQIVAVFCGGLAEVWEAGAAAYAARYPNTAADTALDEVASITGTVRDAPVKTLVTGQVTMAPNKALPAGSVAHLNGLPSARFVTLAEVAANPGGGTFSVEFEAETAGPIAVVANQLNTIAEAVDGWLAVDNADPASVTGSAASTDSELRAKRVAELTRPGSTSVDAIRADVLAVAGVIDATVTEDESAATIAVVTRGGTADAICTAIFGSKAAGIGTTGTAFASVVDTQGVAHGIYYTPASAQVLYVAITVEVGTTFDLTDGPGDIKTAIVAYINALGISEDSLLDLVKAAAYTVTGVRRVSAATQGLFGLLTAADFAVGAGQYATTDVANIAVTVVT